MVKTINLQILNLLPTFLSQIYLVKTDIKSQTHDVGILSVRNLMATNYYWGGCFALFQNDNILLTREEKYLNLVNLGYIL